MKKAILCFWIFLALLAMTCAAAEEPKITLAAEKAESAVTLTVSISEGAEICGCKCNIVYDSTKLQVGEYTRGEPVQNTSFLVNTAYAENAIRVVWASVQPLTAGGTVLTLTFTVADGAEGSAVFTVDALSMVDVNGAKVACGSENATVVLTEEKEESGNSSDTGTTRPPRPSGSVSDKGETAAVTEAPEAPEEDYEVFLMAFTDVPETAWYYDSVLYVNKNALMNGVSETAFSPETNVTRAMAVTILYRLAGSPAAGAPAFADVPLDAWYADSVAWAAEKEIVRGIGDGLFAPDADVTREQLATMLYQYTLSVADAAETADLAAYGDGAEVSAWATASMQWAVGRGLITGKNDKMLCPADTATRAEVATMLYRYPEK